MFINQIVDRFTTILLLCFAIFSLILAISVVEGRIQDLQNKQAILERYNQQITTLTSVTEDVENSKSLQATLQTLQKGSFDYQSKIEGADGTIAFGSSSAWANIRANHLCNPANYFHGMSSDTNLLLIGLLSCMIAYAAGRLYTNCLVTMHDLSLSALTGLIAVLAIKGGRTFVADPTATGVDVTSPYGIALFSALAGLYTTKFYNFLTIVAAEVLVDKSKATPPSTPEDPTGKEEQGATPTVVAAAAVSAPADKEEDGGGKERG